MRSGIAVDSASNCETPAVHWRGAGRPRTVLLTAASIPVSSGHPKCALSRGPAVPATLVLPDDKCFRNFCHQIPPSAPIHPRINDIRTARHQAYSFKRSLLGGLRIDAHMLSKPDHKQRAFGANSHKRPRAARQFADSEKRSQPPSLAISPKYLQLREDALAAVGRIMWLAPRRGGVS